MEEFQDVAEFSFSEEAFQNVQHYPFLYQRKMHLLPGRYDMERFTESAASYREALKYDPEQPELLNALGQSELRAGNHEAAIEAFSRSLEISPEQREVQAILQQLEKDPTKMHP